MVAIYLCSTETSAGKTALAVGLARLMARRGLKLGYFKPLGISDVSSTDVGDKDARFVKQALELNDGLDVLSPLLLAHTGSQQAVAKPEMRQVVKECFNRIASGNDVVLIEGVPDLHDGADVGVPAHDVVEALDAKVLLVMRYRGEATAHNVTEALAFLGSQPAGMIINAVPKEQMSYVTKSLLPKLKQHQIPVLGVLPLERALLGGSVAELAAYLGAVTLCCADKVNGQLIESVMVGARSFGSALPYFSRRGNKAVVTGAARPDIQLAALETSTQCIVVTGGGKVDATVIEQSAAVGIPLLSVAESTAETIERIEGFLRAVRFRQGAKIEKMEQLIAASVNLDELLLAFGVAN